MPQGVLEFNDCFCPPKKLTSESELRRWSCWVVLMLSIPVQHQTSRVAADVDSQPAMIHRRMTLELILDDSWQQPYHTWTPSQYWRPTTAHSQRSTAGWSSTSSSLSSPASSAATPPSKPPHGDACSSCSYAHRAVKAGIDRDRYI